MIRLILLAILLLLSFLAVCKAPEYHLWLISILVSELPWLFAGIVLLLLALGFRTDKYQLSCSIVGIVALLLFLSPIARAYTISRNLLQNFETAFGIHFKENAPQPYSFWRSVFNDHKQVSYSTVTYIDYVNISLKLDFYHAQIAGKQPCVIIVHGGSWSSGDSKQIPELNSLLAQKGYHMAAINYRLSPEYNASAPIEDISNALAYLRKHSAELQIDTTKFVLLGRSAGAQIALLAAYTLEDPAIKGVIDFYGPADMVWGYSVPSSPLIMDSRKVMDDYLGGPYSKIPQKYVASSPVEFVSSQSPPTLIIHGKNDGLVAYEHSRRLNEKLQQKGVKHFWLKLPWATHGFDYIQNGPGGQLANFTIEQFLNSVTR